MRSGSRSSACGRASTRSCSAPRYARARPLSWPPSTGARSSAVCWRLHPPLAGAFDARQALAELSGLPADGRLLLVGHEPDLSGVVGDLTGARPDLKKGGLAVVRLESAAGGELVVLLRPRELALIAGGVSGVGGGPIDGD